MVDKIYVNPDRIISSINSHIYGQFLEHFHRCVYEGIYDPTSELSDQDGFREDVLEAIRRLKVPNLRWPGGCYVSAYHWENGIGDKNQRPTTYDYAWRVPDTHQFGTAEFIKLSKKVDSEPYLAVNAGTGSPEEAAHWLEYCNGKSGTNYADQRVEDGYKDPFNVKYWSVGNENYGDWEIGAKSPSDFSRFVTETAKMMRRFDSDIKIIAPAVFDYNWIKELIFNSGKWIHYVAIHSYYYPNLDPGSIFEEEAAAPLVMERLVKWIIASIDSLLPLSDVKKAPEIAFDEWNLKGWAHNHPNTLNPDIGVRDQNDENDQYTMGDAVFTAGFLNMLHRHSNRVTLANFSPLVNVRGAIYTHKDGIVLRPTYHVFDLYMNYLGKELVDSYVETDNYEINLKDGSYQVPEIEVSATRKDDTIALSVINRSSDTEKVCSIELLKGKMLDSIQHWTLTGSSTQDFNDKVNPDRVKIESIDDSWEIKNNSNLEICIPEHSVNVIHIPLNN